MTCLHTDIFDRFLDTLNLNEFLVSAFYPLEVRGHVFVCPAHDWNKSEDELIRHTVNVRYTLLERELVFLLTVNKKT